jgi:enamine deaminase RidA (YjgF/YER057c/UK114 family)
MTGEIHMTRLLVEPDPDHLWASAAKGLLAGGTLYLSGQVALDSDMNVVGSDIAAQAERALSNIQDIVRAAGGTMADIVHLTLYFVNRDDAPGYFEVARRFFGASPPPATGVVVAGLLMPELLIEIDARAVITAR